MYEILNALISIIAGIYLYLIAAGKIKSRINETTLIKYSKAMKGLAIFFMAFGIIGLFTPFS